MSSPRAADEEQGKEGTEEYDYRALMSKVDRTIAESQAARGSGGAGGAHVSRPFLRSPARPVRAS